MRFFSQKSWGHPILPMQAILTDAVVEFCSQRVPPARKVPPEVWGHLLKQISTTASVKNACIRKIGCPQLFLLKERICQR